ncbi:hypothetical protein TTHERM_000030139 (macronuclear) [Tetrahymena thermophila SB210]|uniref:Uncharacterized protein n=1 Tax=Tetrahymena thermophila (strain SB210) TaxID=312017 RepID=W7X649_TETTS|nr:hypothetical protein TTHERM_000030139 [Tetrahymena thermophila SB210]EWS74845.1 hypothetical protein TTHERM_000030139 [Tetrahymena thermophila SB210]|eukprot:XP_012652558.1 hypothetical protein TTHERM_000030139 [Tetrahymena thermophila SB210]
MANQKLQYKKMVNLQNFKFLKLFVKQVDNLESYQKAMHPATEKLAQTHDETQQQSTHLLEPSYLQFEHPEINQFIQPLDQQIEKSQHEPVAQFQKYCIHFQINNCKILLKQLSSHNINLKYNHSDNSNNLLVKSFSTHLCQQLKNSQRKCYNHQIIKFEIRTQYI